MARTRAELEKENARLWEKLEAIYGQLHDLFGDEDEEEEDEEE